MTRLAADMSALSSAFHSCGLLPLWVSFRERRVVSAECSSPLSHNLRLLFVLELSLLQFCMDIEAYTKRRMHCMKRNSVLNRKETRVNGTFHTVDRFVIRADLRVAHHLLWFEKQPYAKENPRAFFI